MKENLINFGLQGVTGKFEGASDAYIAEIEAQCGFALPNDYKMFAQSYGASLFGEYCGYRPLEPSPWAANALQTVDVFYGMSENAGFDLRKVNARLANLIVGSRIVVGQDAGANLLLLDRDGGVYFYDHETGRTYLCAIDFDHFIDSFEKL